MRGEGCGFLKFGEGSLDGVCNSRAMWFGELREWLRNPDLATPKASLLQLCDYGLVRYPFPVASSLTLEFSLKCSRRKYGAATALPALLTLVKFT